jgi:hypothetical protein
MTDITKENFDSSARIVAEVLNERLGGPTGPNTLLALRIVAALDEVLLIADDSPSAPSALEARLKALEDVVRNQVTKHAFTRRENRPNMYSASDTLYTSCTCGWSHERRIYPGHVRQGRASVEQAMTVDELFHLESEGVK